MQRSGALFSTLMKKNTLIFVYTRFFVEMTKNNQKINMLKTAKNQKMQKELKINTIKTTKNY